MTYGELFDKLTQDEKDDLYLRIAKRFTETGDFKKKVIKINNEKNKSEKVKT